MPAAVTIRIKELLRETALEIFAIGEKTMRVTQRH